MSSSRERAVAKSAALRARLNRTIARITANVVVSRVLAVVADANEAGVPLFASALAFTTMFAVVPVLLLIAGLLGWLVEDAAQREALLGQLVSYLPPLQSLLQASLDTVVRERSALSIAGLVGMLWGSSNFYAALDEVMRRIFPGGPARNEFARRGRGVVTVLILLALIAGTVSLGGLWAFVGQLVGNLAIWSYVVPLFSLAVMVMVVLGAYLLVPTRPPSARAALPPAIVAGVGIGLLTNLFSLLAPWLIGGLSGFGVIATVFGAFVWLNLSYEVLLYGAAWARLRRDRESTGNEVPE